MKTYFILNPAAGQGNGIRDLELNILDAFRSADVEIYLTKRPGDAKAFVEKCCISGEKQRFIACGGDGTLSEVLNGAISCENTEIGVIPIGTGNDFCRNFDKNYSFNDVNAQLNGESVSCDAIKYTAIENGKTKVGYCVNMFNIGFDCNVADMTANMKKKPFISGSLAYFISILVNLAKKKGADIKIEMDGKIIHDGKLLLTSIANGCFCGGGIKSNPLACVQDGLINVNIVKDVSRIKFLKLLPHYMKGDFLQIKNIESVVSSPKCKNIKVTPYDRFLKLCIDGEITTVSKVEFEIVPNAFKFVLPSSNVMEPV